MKPNCCGAPKAVRPIPDLVNTTRSVTLVRRGPVAINHAELAATATSVSNGIHNMPCPMQRNHVAGCVIGTHPQTVKNRTHLLPDEPNSTCGSPAVSSAPAPAGSLTTTPHSGHRSGLVSPRRSYPQLRHSMGWSPNAGKGNDPGRIRAIRDYAAAGP